MVISFFSYQSFYKAILVALLVNLFIADSLSYLFFENNFAAIEYFDHFDGEKENEKKEKEENSDDKYPSDRIFSDFLFSINFQDLCNNRYFQTLHHPETYTPPPELIII